MAGKSGGVVPPKVGILLEAYRESMEERGTKMLYLLTDHIRFDERYGWEYLCDAMGEGEDTPAGCTEKVRNKRASAL